MAEKEDFFEERLGGEIIKGERERAEGMWRGILTDFGESSWVVFVGVKKWVGRTEEREREMDAAGGGITMALERDDWFSSSRDWVSGFFWIVGSISIGEMFELQLRRISCL